VTAEQVRYATIALLGEQIPLGVRGYRYSDADIFNVVVAGAAQGRSLSSVCQQLVDAPSDSLVRHYLTERLFDQEGEALEAQLNRLLVARLPPAVRRRPQRLAIDLTLLPYYGTEGIEPDQLRRGEAKAGTTRFHCYATVSVLHRDRRVSLAVTFVHADEALVDVLTDLVERVQRLDIGISRLFLDREFASVAVLTWLVRQPFPAIVALPKRGARLKALLTGRASYRTTYTMQSAAAGALTFPLVVAVTGRGVPSRRTPPGRSYQPFAVVGQGADALPVRRVAREYRDRFGIESSYRQMNTVRAPTSSRDPALRLLLVTVALLLINLWVWLKDHLTAATPLTTRRRVRLWMTATFPLARFCDLLIEAIKDRYHARSAISCPFTLRAPLKL
jgi:putative transposase